VSEAVRERSFDDGRATVRGQRINFHAMMRDAAHMKDRLGYGLFRAAGVPAPRSVHARLIVNGDDLGVFALVEEIDGEFVEDHFRAVDGSGDGNLYKEVWPMFGGPGPYAAALRRTRSWRTSTRWWLAGRSRMRARSRGGERADGPADAGELPGGDRWIDNGMARRLVLQCPGSAATTTTTGTKRSGATGVALPWI
jgi:hypothetical protein